MEEARQKTALPFSEDRHLNTQKGTYLHEMSSSFPSGNTVESESFSKEFASSSLVEGIYSEPESSDTSV